MSAQPCARTDVGVRFFGLILGTYLGGCLKNSLSVELFNEEFNSVFEKSTMILTIYTIASCFDGQEKGKPGFH